MADITKAVDAIVVAYTNGLITKEEANAKLENLGVDLRVTDENRKPAVATVVDGVVNGEVLLDMGLGTKTKVKVVDNVMPDFDAGAMHVLAIVNEKDIYEVNGNKIGKYKGPVKK